MIAPHRADGTPRFARPYALTAEHYDALLGRRMLPLFLRNFVTLVRRYRIPHATVADVGCGTGEFARRLSEAGIAVVGVDRSPEMIRIARRRSSGTGARFLVQDIRDLCLPGPVQVVTCNFDVLNYLSRPEDLRRALRRIRRNLVPDGHLLFDMVTSVGTNLPEESSWVVHGSGMPSTWHVRIAPGSGLRRVVIRQWTPDGREAAREIHTQRAYAADAVCAGLRRSGFVVLGVHDTERIEEPGWTSRRATFVARRSGGSDEPSSGR